MRTDVAHTNPGNVRSVAQFRVLNARSRCSKQLRYPVTFPTIIALVRSSGGRDIVQKSNVKEARKNLLKAITDVKVLYTSIIASIYARAGLQ